MTERSIFPELKESLEECVESSRTQKFFSEQEKQELKLELNNRISELKEYISEEDINDQKLDLLLIDLSDTFKLCVRKQVKFELEEL